MNTYISDSWDLNIWEDKWIRGSELCDTTRGNCRSNRLVPRGSPPEKQEQSTQITLMFSPFSCTFVMGKVKMIVQDGYLLCWTMAFVATQIINVFYLGFVGSKFSGDPYIMIDCSFTVFLLTTKWDYRKMVLYQYDIKYDIIALVG